FELSLQFGFFGFGGLAGLGCPAGAFAVLLGGGIPVGLGALEGLLELRDAGLNFLLPGGVLRAVSNGILVGVLSLLELALELDDADFGCIELLQRIVEAARELLLLALDRFQLSLGLAQIVLEFLDLIPDLLAHP